MTRIMRVLSVCILVLCTSSAYSASKTVLVLGDSLSAEYGLERGTGWVALLQERINSEKIAATTVNVSISGETSSGGNARLRPLLQKYRPDIVIIELGANDGLRGLPLMSLEENLRAMIGAARRADAKVLLIGMQIPPNYGNDYRRQFSSVYKKVAQATDTPLVPFLLNGIATQIQFFQQDRIHPNSKAHPIILDNVWPHLKPLLLK